MVGSRCTHVLCGGITSSEESRGHCRWTLQEGPVSVERGRRALWLAEHSSANALITHMGGVSNIVEIL
eukprot:5660958-Heterocapsa_arctica.AAC.1